MFDLWSPPCIPPTPINTQTSIPPFPPPHILNSCQQRPDQRTSPICRRPLNVRGPVCMWVCIGGIRNLLFTSLIPAVVLSRALWHTFGGYGCFKSDIYASMSDLFRLCLHMSAQLYVYEYPGFCHFVQTENLANTHLIY